jgi:TatD DNase family protein
MIDSHCHLGHGRYGAEAPFLTPEELLTRAAAAGVTEMVTIACERDEWAPALTMASEPTPQNPNSPKPRLWVAAGIHPASVEEGLLPTVAELLEVAKNPCVVALGETGLDAPAVERSDDPARTQAAQEAAFRIHLEAARASGLPVSLHTRGYEDRCLEIMAGFPEVGFVYHCFTGSAVQARAVVGQGGYVSLAGIVTFTNAKELQAAAREIPPDRLLLETDAPYLAPVPFRGKRNEPALVAEVYKYVAVLHDLPVTELAARVAANFHRLFARATL